MLGVCLVFEILIGDDPVRLNALLRKMQLVVWSVGEIQGSASPTTNTHFPS